MTASSVLLWSIARTIIVATLAVWLSQRVLHNLAQQTGACRRLWLVAVLLPLLVPELLIGFTYRLTAQQLTDSVGGTELLYAVILLIRAWSVSALVLLLVPRSAVTRESIHAWALLQRGGRAPRWNHWRLLFSGPYRGSTVAWCLTSLLTFQDFETAALIQVDQHPIVWTVWLFDANAGHQQLATTFGMIMGPVLFELTLLSAGLWLISGRTQPVSAATPEPVAIGFTGTWLPLAGTITAVAIVLVWPVLLSLHELPGGLAALSRDPAALIRQQADSLGFSVTAATVALSCAVLLRRADNIVLTCIALLPGLAGSLALSLTLLGAFQLPGLRLLWDTWLPLLLGQSLLVLPRAWVLVLALESLTIPAQVHSARLLQAAGDQRNAATRLLWRLVSARWLLAVAVLCHWCTWDVTTASILRPVSVEPVVTRLYQEMHFSRTESLTALAAITVLVPWLITATVLTFRQFSLRP